MPVSFIKTSNSATTGLALGAPGQDVVVKKIIIGLPVNSGNVAIYDITNPLPSFNAANDAALKFKHAYTASVSESSLKVFDFTTMGEASGEHSSMSQGLLLSNGGNVMVDQTMNVTVIWDYLV